MIRVMNFVSLTDEDVRNIATFGDVVAKVREAVTRNGGTLEQAWQTAGIYDFVAVLSFPDFGGGVPITERGLQDGCSARTARTSHPA
jgi:uncharacterized protein with GYD domain